MNHSFAIFAYGDVGVATVRMFRNRKDELKFVLLDKDNFWNKNQLIIDALEGYNNTEIIYYTSNEELLEKCEEIDLVILAWWGKIIDGELLKKPKYGFMNLHTSFLPYSKGKHPHYWAIVDQKPYGVTIMMINEGLDTGPIVFQKEIKYTWCDTGKSLYFKGIKVMCDLLEEKKEEILNLNFACKEQKEEGTFHYGSEINKKSYIELDKKYTARELLNIIRARSFEPFPGAYFEENGEKYEIEMKIRKVGKEFDSSKIEYDKIKGDDNE